MAKRVKTPDPAFDEGQIEDFEKSFMSVGWKARRSRIVLPMLDHPRGGLTRKECTDLGVPSPRGLSDLRGVFKEIQARSLDDVARRTCLDTFLEIPGVSEAAVAVFIYLLIKTHANTHPSDWVLAGVKITTRKDQLKKKKRKKR